MKKKLIPVLVIAISLFIVQNAQAQGGFYLGVQAGYSAQKPSLKDVEFNTNTTYLYGVRAGIKFMMIALEAQYFQAAHNLEIKELVTFDWADRQVDYNYLGLNLKFFFPILFLHPYLTAGYGYYNADIENIDEDKSTGFNLGVGVEIHLGKKLSLVAEGKYHRAKFDVSNQDLKVGDFTLSGGISFYF